MILFNKCYFTFRIHHEWDYLNINDITIEFLSQCKNLSKMELSGDVEDIIRRSRDFHIPFPIQTVR